VYYSPVIIFNEWLKLLDITSIYTLKDLKDMTYQ